MNEISGVPGHGPLIFFEDPGSWVTLMSLTGLNVHGGGKEEVLLVLFLTGCIRGEVRGRRTD